MMTFRQMLEDMVNYNHTNQHWQVRHDSPGHVFKGEHPHVILKNAKPHVDHDAHEEGKRVYAYMHGTPTKETPQNTIKRAIKFNPGNTEHPFVHKDDGTPVKHAHYVEFHGREVHAHYKK
jgi:hypothetical protein